MSLTLIGPSGSIETPWIRYALLRDNVMHHMEGGNLTSRFTSLYSLAAALGGTPTTVNARRLREELVEVVAKLPSIPVEQLAISARTQAVIRFDTVLPIGPPTELRPGAVTMPWMPESAETLGDIFGFLMREIMRITEGATEQDEVQAVAT